jgi:hypothetical protein
MKFEDLTAGDVFVFAEEAPPQILYVKVSDYSQMRGMGTARTQEDRRPGVEVPVRLDAEVVKSEVKIDTRALRNPLFT